MHMYVHLLTRDKCVSIAEVFYVPVLSNTVEPIWSILSLDASNKHKENCSLILIFKITTTGTEHNQKYIKLQTFLVFIRCGSFWKGETLCKHKSFCNVHSFLELSQFFLDVSKRPFYSFVFSYLAMDTCKAAGVLALMQTS